MNEEIGRLKIEEDTALVLLALSGHRIDDKIKQRITVLCKAATELKELKGQIQEGYSVKDNRDSISDARMRHSSRCEVHESTSIYEKDVKIPQETRIETYPYELSLQKSNPELDDMQKILHTLEITQQRLRNLNSTTNDLSFER